MNEKECFRCMGTGTQNGFNCYTCSGKGTLPQERIAYLIDVYLPVQMDRHKASGGTKGIDPREAEYQLGQLRQLREKKPAKSRKKEQPGASPE